MAGCIGGIAEGGDSCHGAATSMILGWKTVVLVMVGLGLCSCGTVPASKHSEEDPEDQEKKEIKASEASIRVVGEIVSVHPEEGFVLIRSFGGGRLPSGGALTAVDRGGGSSALKPTGERLGKFHAADVSGRLPAAGDLVLARELPDSGLQISPEGPPSR